MLVLLTVLVHYIHVEIKITFFEPRMRFDPTWWIYENSVIVVLPELFVVNVLFTVSMTIGLFL